MNLAALNIRQTITSSLEDWRYMRKIATPSPAAWTSFSEGDSARRRPLWNCTHQECGRGVANGHPFRLVTGEGWSELCFVTWQNGGLQVGIRPVYLL